ncbi:sulfurtransferase TusA family protein [Halobacillus litoralis]|uniref:sulfurtransferase TusA family protein n=1 Tax=Halobacillus litoralis TaxID=45668 RepID=UPI001CD7C227|nr:sulfurtransferase TusA family protein [Halobacillus litoralis]MCA1020689.1 sulfurtransferase TusA family protein [Halobacillus litoralis]
MDVKTDVTLDAKGTACPMPIVKTKKSMKGMESGQVLEVQATDKGSTADLQAWTKSAGHQYLGTIEEDGVLKHYVRKANDDETREKKHPDVVDNEELNAVRSNSESIIVDVREAAEYAFHHIPEAVSIPLGEIDDRGYELDQSKTVYVVCRTGSRSDLAAQKLAAKGFPAVYNVVPGMSAWNGETKSLNQ